MNKKNKKLSIANYGFRAQFLLVLALVFLGVLIASLQPADKVSAAIYSTINFQGKVVNSNGTNIADGTYNMQFKLYTGGNGVVGGGDETLQWTEERLRNNSQGVTITDGIFQVNLGSVTALPDIFNNDTVWLSMNLGNTNATCTPFSNCSPDGEMSPMIRMTAAPYALNSDRLGGLQAASFVQLAQGLQTDASTANASIAINKTGGTANILTLQRAGSDVLTIDTNGVSTFSDDVTLTLAETEDLAVNLSISGTNSGQGQIITLTNSSSSGNQYGLYIDNAANSGTTESLLALDNSDTDTAVTNAIEFIDDNGGFTNLFNVDGTLISQTEFVALDNGIELGDLTTQGTATDEFCLTSETGGGALLAWQACGGGGGDLDSVYDADSDKHLTVDNTAGLTFDLTTTGDFVVEGSGVAVLTIDSSGDTLIQRSGADSATAFQIQDSGDAPAFTVDTINNETEVVHLIVIADTTLSGNLTLNAGAGENVEIIAAAAPTVDLVAISNTGQGTTTSGVNGLEIDFVTGDGASLNHSGLQIDLVSGGTVAGDIINGISITMDAADASTQNGIVIGANFDVGIDAGNNTIVNIGNAGTDFTSTGGLTLAEILTVNDDVDVNLAAGEDVMILDSAAPTASLLHIVSDALTTTTGVHGLEIDFTTGNGTNPTNSGLQIDLASGGTVAGDIINGISITMDAADASTQNGIVIGANFDSQISGTGWSVDGSGNLTVASCTGCGGAVAWDAIGDPSGNGAINFGTTEQTMDWEFTTTAHDGMIFNFDNNGGTAGSDNGIVINNALSTATGAVDLNTESLLLIQQLDNDGTGITVVDNAIKIDVAANSGITDGIEITNSAGNLTTGINIVDTGGGTIGTGVVIDGAGIGIAVSNYGTTGMNLGAIGSQTGLLLSTAGMTTGVGINLSGTAALGSLSDTSGDAIRISHDISKISGAGTVTYSGNMIDISPVYAIDIAGGTFNHTGDLVTLSTTYTETTGTLTDSRNILSLSQNCGTNVDCTAAVLEINNAGTGQGLLLNSSATGLLAQLDATAGVTVADGLLVRATHASGVITDALDVSDAEIVNGLNIGSNFLVASGDSINDFSGNGLAVSSNVLTVNLTTSGTTGSTASNSGLEVGSAGLTLLKGCADNEILKYSDAGGWACSTDQTGGGSADLDIVYDNDTDQTMTVDNAAGLTFDFAGSGAGGDFVIEDAGTLGLVFDTNDHHLKIYENVASPSKYLELYHDGTDGIIVASSGTTKVGSGSGPVSIVAGSGAAVTITGNAASTWSTSSGDLTITGGAGLNLNSTSSAGIVLTPASTGDITLSLDSDSFLIVGSDSINDFTGNGLAVSSGALTVQLLDASDGAGGTGSRSGLEFGDSGSNELTLLQGCSDGQILKWDDATDVQWECAADASGGGGSPTLDSVTAAVAGSGVEDNNAHTIEWNWDFTSAATDSGLLISESSASTSGTQDQQALLELVTLSSSTASPLQVTAGGADVGDIWFNLSGSSDLEIRDSGTAFATFNDSGGITFAPINGSDINFTLDNDTALISTGTVTDTGFLEDINLTLGNDAAADTVSALNIDVTSVDTGADSDVLQGIDIANLSGGNSNVTEQALRIGTGWDLGILVASGGIHVTGGGISLNGGTAASSDLLTSNLGINITDSDTNPGCAAGEFKIYADTSENKLKKCQNGTASDLDTGGGGGLPDSASFTDTTTETLTDANTDLGPGSEWVNNGTGTDAVVPNITPAATSEAIMVAVSVRVTDDSPSDFETNTFQIRRTTGGTDPTCSSTQVGTFFGATFSDKTEETTATYVVLDYPNTTSITEYIVCSSTESSSGGSFDNVSARVDMTLVQLGADLAENYYTTDGSIEPGHVVSIDSSLPAGAKKSSRPYDPNVLGIVSTKPGALLDDAIGLGFGRAIPVALKGRIPVKVSTENGPIRPGDLLTSSSIPGVAMKATKAGAIVGSAMTGFSGEGIGVVMAFAKDGSGSGASTAGLFGEGHNSTGDLGKDLLSLFMTTGGNQFEPVDLSEVVTDRLVAGLEVITPKVVTDKVALNSIEAATSEYIEINNDVVINGTLKADKIVANQIEGLEILVSSIASRQSQGDQQAGENTTVVAGTSTDGSAVSFQSGVFALDLTVNGVLTANGGLVVNGLAQFNGETIFDKLVTFEDKSLFKGDAEFEGRTTFNNDSGGFATIETGAKEVEILFDKPYESSPVISLAVKNGRFVQYAYEEIKVDDPEHPDHNKIKGFKILLSASAATDTEFSWTAFAIKDGRTAISVPSHQN